MRSVTVMVASLSNVKLDRSAYLLGSSIIKISCTLVSTAIFLL